MRPRSDRGETFGIYGLKVSCGLQITPCLIRVSGPPDLRIETSSSPPGAWQEEAAYESPFRDEAGRCALRILRRESFDLLAFPGVAEFSVAERTILCRPARPQRRELIEIRLLGTVLAFFLERSGIPVLHASAVEVGGAAVAFLGSNRGGKSGLAGAFLKAGFPLLSDDILPLDIDLKGDGPEDRSLEGRGPEGIQARPAYPQMRAWPDLAAHLTGSFENLPRVLPELEKRRIAVGGEGGLGSFCAQARPLAVLYLPQRRPPGEGEAIRIEALSPRDALVELLRASFIARPVAALGWQPRRIDAFSRLVERVPLRRLSYPSGFEHLDRVREAVLEDVSC